MDVLDITTFTTLYSFENSSIPNAVVNDLSSAKKTFGRHEFVHSSPATAVPILVVLVLATTIGTFGNIVTLTLVCTRNVIRSVERIFIVNLAISDLYVTTLADIMSLLAKIEGEEFFDKIPGLCQTIASLCTVSCVTSLMTIGLMSVNRLFCVCYHEKYERVFTKCTCICMCVAVYFVGGFLVLMNAAGIGGHGFDRKSLECIWDRMATYPYTVVFSITLVWIPAITIGICYTKIYLFVRAHKKRMKEQNPAGTVKSVNLTRTLFLIYAVFTTCWLPYALILVADVNDTFPHQAHVYIVVFAHLHPSLTWFIYYLTNKRYAAGFRQLFLDCWRKEIPTAEISVSTTAQFGASPKKLPWKTQATQSTADSSLDESKL